MAILKLTFINTVKGQAMKDMVSCKILASLTIAQAILESGWGSSALTVKANNLFGIKAGTSWAGPTVTMPTTEYVNGTAITVQAAFRKYDSWSDSIIDHTKLLLNSRYQNILGDTDYKSVCSKIKQDGYATDPDYTSKLISIIESNNLNEIDQEIIIERMVNGMDNKTLQSFLNENGFTDSQGNKLIVDGVIGPKTQAAIAKAKAVIGYILR